MQAEQQDAAAPSNRNRARRKRKQIRKCHICKKFKTFRKRFMEIHLEQHAKLESGSNRFHRCEECFKLCPDDKSLKSHERIHREETKIHLCGFCEYSSRDTSGLKQHILTHTKVKPWHCPIKGCTVSLTSKQWIQRHLEEKNGHELPRSEQPPIKRQIPYTLFHYSGGLLTNDNVKMAFLSDEEQTRIRLEMRSLEIAHAQRLGKDLLRRTSSPGLLDGVQRLTLSSPERRTVSPNSQWQDSPIQVNHSQAEAFPGDAIIAEAFRGAEGGSGASSPSPDGGAMAGGHDAGSAEVSALSFIMPQSPLGEAGEVSLGEDALERMVSVPDEQLFGRVDVVQHTQYEAGNQELQMGSVLQTEREFEMNNSQYIKAEYVPENNNNVQLARQREFAQENIISNQYFKTEYTHENQANMQTGAKTEFEMGNAPGNQYFKTEYVEENQGDFGMGIADAEVEFQTTLDNPENVPMRLVQPGEVKMRQLQQDQGEFEMASAQDSLLTAFFGVTPLAPTEVLEQPEEEGTACDALGTSSDSMLTLLSSSPAEPPYTSTLPRIEKSSEEFFRQVLSFRELERQEAMARESAAPPAVDPDRRYLHQLPPVVAAPWQHTPQLPTYEEHMRMRSVEFPDPAVTKRGRRQRAAAQRRRAKAGVPVGNHGNQTSSP